MIATCKHCGKEYKTFSSFVKRSHGNTYCSKTCAGAARTERAQTELEGRPCPTCGKILRIGRVNTKQRYCSNLCAAKGRTTGVRNVLCQACGKIFLKRGGGYQLYPKYCSRSCYVTARFGRPPKQVAKEDVPHADLCCCDD